MLRVEGRRRADRKLRETDRERLSAWLNMLEKNNAVVYYDPDTVAGFYYVPRVDEDTDIIRRPGRKTTRRRAAN